MKNIAFIIIALLGLSLSSYAQDGSKKQTEPAKVEIKKRSMNTTPIKKEPQKKAPVKKETPAPVKKEN